MRNPQTGPRGSAGHGGIRDRRAFTTAIDEVEDALPRRVFDGLKAISQAPQRVQNPVPVHADCHWGNWLANGTELTALLDFEWARFGDPLDDWFFLAWFSGPHMHAVLALIADETEIPLQDLRAECEAPDRRSPLR